MIYKLDVTQRAKQDRDRAFDWYCRNYSPEFAARWYEEIAQAVESLPRDPLRCHTAIENDCFPFELYELLCGRRKNKHRILFTLKNDTVLVLHIRHSAQRELEVGDL